MLHWKSKVAERSNVECSAPNQATRAKRRPSLRQGAPSRYSTPEAKASLRFLLLVPPLPLVGSLPALSSTFKLALLPLCRSFPCTSFGRRSPRLTARPPTSASLLRQCAFFAQQASPLSESNHQSCIYHPAPLHHLLRQRTNMQEAQDAQWTGAEESTWSAMSQQEPEQQDKDGNSAVKSKKKPMVKNDKPPLPRGSAW